MAEIISPRRDEVIIGPSGRPTSRFIEFLEAITLHANLTAVFMDIVLVDGIQPTVTTIVTLYTSPTSGSGSRVTAFTATNNSGGAASYDLHIVPSGGAADATNKLVNAKSLAAAADDVPAQVIDQLIPRGGTLETKVSVGTSIAFRATGNEI